ncbi:MAG: hypothetical protein WC347_02830 [Smithellaceae bacterium]|jgi:transposase-like protein
METAKNITSQDNDINPGIFTPREVFAEFNAEFLDDEKCRQWIIEILHPENKKCPECGEEILNSLLQSFWDGKRIKCWYCGKYFTALTNTFLSGCHLNFQQIVLMSMLIGLGVPDKVIALIIKISAESVRLWRLKFRELEKIKT